MVPPAKSAAKTCTKVVARDMDHAVAALAQGRVRRMDLRYRRIGDRGAERVAEILLENRSGVLKEVFGHGSWRKRGKTCRFQGL